MYYKYVTKRKVTTKDDKTFCFIDVLINNDFTASIVCSENYFNQCNLEMGDDIPEDAISINLYKVGKDIICHLSFK